LLEWINDEEALKQAIIKSLGRVVRQVTKSPIDGFTLMTIMDIMDKVRARYGRMQTDTRAQLDERMKTRISQTETFDTHLSNLTENYAISEIGGYPIAQDKQVKIFRTSVYGNPLIANALESFDLKFPDVRTHTFAAITEYVIDHLPNLQNASKEAARATASIMTSEVYLTLEAENKKLKATQATQATQASTKKRKNGKGKGKGKPGKNKKNRANGDKGPEKTKLYCYAHVPSTPTPLVSINSWLATWVVLRQRCEVASSGPNQPPWWIH
jgi:hypothetical protein